MHENKIIGANIKSIIKYIGIIVVLLTFPFVGTSCFLIPKEQETLAPPLKEPQQITYNYIELKNTTFENKIEVVGYFISSMQKDISFINQSGRLKTIHVKSGDIVKKGDLLAELVTDNIENQINQQEILLKKSQLTYDSIKINQKKDIDLITIQIDKLKSRLDTLLVTNSYYQEDVKDIEEQIKVQEVMLESAKLSYENSLENAKNDIELNKLKLKELKDILSSSRLLSPISGIVDYITSAKDGDYIDAYSTVVRVADPRDLELQYTGDKVTEFKLGMEAAVKLGEESYSGKVIMTPDNAPSDADEKTKKSIKIKLETLPADVEMGDSAEITLMLNKKENVIVINKNLIHNVGTRKYVNILEDDVKKERDVETGDENQTEVIIVKGLSEGDKLIKD